METTNTTDAETTLVKKFLLHDVSDSERIREDDFFLPKEFVFLIFRQSISLPGISKNWQPLPYSSFTIGDVILFELRRRTLMSNSSSSVDSSVGIARDIELFSGACSVFLS